MQLTKLFPNACSETRILSYDVAFVDLFTGVLTGVEKTGHEGLRRLRLLGLSDSRHLQVVKLSAVGAGHLYPQQRSLVLISVGG